MAPGRPPEYADTLHERLSHYLDASLLGDDPHRKRAGAVRMVRLCRQRTAARITPDRGGPPTGGPMGLASGTRCRHLGAHLTDGQGRIAHVALVYSRLQDTRRRHPGSTIDALAKALFSLPQYASFPELLRMAIVDARATMRRPAQDGRASSPSLRVR